MEIFLINIKTTTIVKRIISISPKIISCLLKNIKFHIKFKKYCINTIDINFDELISDFERLLEYVKYLHPNIPIYLLGESMGGGLSVKISMLIEKISGIILLAPMLGVANKIKPKNYLINFLLKKAKMFNKLFSIVPLIYSVQATCSDFVGHSDGRFGIVMFVFVGGLNVVLCCVLCLVPRVKASGGENSHQNTFVIETVFKVYAYTCM